MHKRDGGSCSHQGNLSFAWRLIMAPLPIIDSVVVHELVHLEVKNHSRALSLFKLFIVPIKLF